MKFTKFLAIPLALCFSPTTHALSFNLNNTTGMSAQYLAGFQAAANWWSAQFSDNATVNINIGIAALAQNILGQAGSSRESYFYSDVRNALAADITSTSDVTAVSNVQTGDYFNYFTNSASAGGFVNPYLDNDESLNNYFISMTTANAKALGLGVTNATAADASITFSSAFSWDFDSSNGISSGTYDFVGVAAHEIGHALGFISNVDMLDVYGGQGYSSDDLTYYGYGPTTLDLFRYSTNSCNAEGSSYQDLSADNRSKYFSIDGCTTNLGTFSTGVVNGDGNQASHWEDDLGLGLMDPTFASREIGNISELDLTALDVIGWNRMGATLPATVPTPSAIGLIGSGLLALFATMQRRKRYAF